MVCRKIGDNCVGGQNGGAAAVVFCQTVTSLTKRSDGSLGERKKETVLVKKSIKEAACIFWKEMLEWIKEILWSVEYPKQRWGKTRKGT